MKLFAVIGLMVLTTGVAVGQTSDQLLWASASIALRACKTNRDFRPVLPSGEGWVAMDCNVLLGFAASTPDYFVEKAKADLKWSRKQKELLKEMQQMQNDLNDGVKKVLGAKP